MNMKTSLNAIRVPRNLFAANEGSGHSHEHHNHAEHEGSGTASGAIYFCPMKCEGDKVYDQPGNCPVCHMKLVPVKE